MMSLRSQTGSLFAALPTASGGTGPPLLIMYQRLELACDCGRQPARIRELGLTVDRQLVIYWRCSQCRKHVYIVKSLADYWRECPSTDVVPQQGTPFQPADTMFLRRVGIRLPEDPDPRQ